MIRKAGRKQNSAICNLLREQWGELFCLGTTLGLSCLIPGVSSMVQTPIRLNWTGEQRVWKGGSSGISICFLLCFPSNLALFFPQLAFGFILITMIFTVHILSTTQFPVSHFCVCLWNSYHSIKAPPDLSSSVTSPDSH